MPFTVIQRNLFRKLHSKAVAVVKAGECDKPEIWNFMKEVFFKIEPSSVMTGVADKKSVSDELLRLVTDRIDENMSFVARSGEEGLAGVAINGARPAEWKSESWKSSANSITCQREKELLLLWQQISRLPKDSSKHFGGAIEIFELEYLSVAPKFQRQGVAKAMLSSTLKEAAERGFCYLRMDCTSAFSAALGRHAGMKKIHEVYYKDLKDSSGKAFDKIKEPHVKAAIYIADLSVR